MPNLQDLGLNEEATPQGDWDAPEAGSFPPVCFPGLYDFIFRLPEKQEDWFDVMEIQVEQGKPKQKFLVIQYEADIVGVVKPDGQVEPVPPDEAGAQPRLRFQRASFYKTPRMPLSMGQDLLRALNIRISGPMTPQAISDAVAQVDGRARFRGEVSWRAYFKGTETTVSTHPRKKKGDLPWPKDQQGQFLEMATNPSTGEKMYGQADINRVKLPR